MAFTGDYLRVAPIELSLLGCDSLITCSPLVRLGDKGETVIKVKIHDAPDYLDLNDVGIAFEANAGGKLIQDENKERFRVIDKHTFEYLCADEVHSFVGTINVAYFVLRRTEKRVTTQNFTIHSLVNAEQNTDGLKDHYVSVIDDLIETNKDAIKQAQKIEDMINKNQVVKKSGDTMTGNLTFQSDTEANIPFRTKTTNQEYVKFYANPTRSRLGVYSTKNSKNVWDYDGDADSFNVNTNTNLLKKNEAFYTYAQPNGRTFQLREGDDLNNYLDTGLFAGTKLVNAPSQDYFYIEVIRYADANYTMQRATTLVGSTAGTWVRRKTGSTWNPWEKIMDQKGGTMTGQLDIQVPAAGSNGVAFKTTTGSDLHKFIGTNSGAVAWQDKVNNIDVFNYSAVNKTLTFLGDTNLLKKTGDTMSGDLRLDRPAATNYRELRWSTAGTDDVILGQDISGNWRAYDPTGGTIFKYDKANKRFTVDTTNTNLVTKTKDGRADLTLTADATNWNPNRPVIATRRGNTVTFRGAIALVSSYTGTNVTTLPRDMRPVDSFTVDILANDGTPHAVSVFASGEISFGATAKGKQLSIMFTYVVD
ncbi:TPA: BppU family phage baseplate upper protein [Bacillus pacificus]